MAERLKDGGKGKDGGRDKIKAKIKEELWRLSERRERRKRERKERE